MVIHSFALPNNALISGVPILELPTNGNPQPLLAEAHATHQDEDIANTFAIFINIYIDIRSYMFFMSL